MAKTAAERQTEYRQRHADECDRINMLVSFRAKLALSRLARHQGKTQRQVLEALLLEAEAATVAKLDNTTAYYDGVTQ